MPKELRVKKGEIELVLPFDSEEDLKSNLEALPNLVSLVSGANLSIEKRTPKPGLEKLHRFTDKGEVEVLIAPKAQLDTILLVMFLKHPQSIRLEELSASSGIPTAVDFLSKKQYALYFNKVSKGVYSLKQPAFEKVTKDIIPALLGIDEVNKECQRN